MIKNGVTKYTMMGMNEYTIHSSPIKVLSSLQIQIWRSSRMGESRMRYSIYVCHLFSSNK
jgi:hypothetical protein